MQFGEKLKNLRKKKNMTQDEVAKAIGISRRAYVAYEQENIHPRKRETYTKLANVLGTDVNYLLLDDGTTSSSIATVASLIGTTFGLYGTTAAIPVGIVAMLATFLPNRSLQTKRSEDSTQSQETSAMSQYENRQKLFKTMALGIIYSTLTKRGITFQPQNVQTVYQLGGYPDECITIIDQHICSWWLVFWGKDPELDDPAIMSAKEKASIIISRFTTVPADPGRQVSILVDDKSLFDAICEYKGNNSYRGNMSVLLIDVDDICIVQEEFVAFYNDDTKQSMISLISTKLE